MGKPLLLHRIGGEAYIQIQDCLKYLIWTVQGLLRASTEGDVSRVRGLLDAGAIVNTIDEYGWMSLHFAAGTNSANVVEVSSCR